MAYRRTDTTAAAGTPDPERSPMEYIRAVWDRFVALGPEIIHLQHRAAKAANAAKVMGSMDLHERGKAIIRALGRLGQLHQRTVDTVRSLGGYIGLSGYRPALGAIPVAVATAFAGLALLVAWIFRRYELQADLVRALEEGTLTREDVEAVRDVGPAPGEEFLRPAVDLGKLILGGLALWVGLQALRVWRPNPTLMVRSENPPDPGGVKIGDRVEQVRYVHAEDGRPYYHDFRGGVEMRGLADGSVLLTHPRRRLWKDFE